MNEKFEKSLGGDYGNVYSDNVQNLIQRKHLIMEEEGILPFSRKLNDINKLLLGGYEDGEGGKIDIRREMEKLGAEPLQVYDEIIEVVKDEQEFLEQELLPTLSQIADRHDFNEGWENVLKEFPDFLELLSEDLKILGKLIKGLENYWRESFRFRKNQRRIIKDHFLRALKINDTEMARYWVRKVQNSGWFTSVELRFLMNLADAVGEENDAQLGILIKRNLFKEIFNEEEAKDFRRILEYLKTRKRVEIPAEIAKALAQEGKKLEQVEKEAEELKKSGAAEAIQLVSDMGEEIKRVRAAADEVMKAVPKIKMLIINNAKKTWANARIRRMKAEILIRKLKWKFLELASKPVFDFDAKPVYYAGEPNQDTHLVDNKFIGKKGWLFAGVYDGFISRQASVMAAMLVERVFKERFLMYKNVEEAFDAAYKFTSYEIKKKTNGGTTAANVFIMGSKLYIAHVGDTRVILCVGGDVKFATEDHNLNNKIEMKRVTGEMKKPADDAMVTLHNLYPMAKPITKALGFRDAPSEVSPVPDIKFIDLDKYIKKYIDLEEYIKKGVIRIIICSDDVFKGTELDNNRLAFIANQHTSAEDSARALARIAKVPNKDKDVTVMVIRLNPIKMKIGQAKSVPAAKRATAKKTNIIEEINILKNELGALIKDANSKRMRYNDPVSIEKLDTCIEGIESIARELEEYKQRLLSADEKEAIAAEISQKIEGIKKQIPIIRDYLKKFKRPSRLSTTSGPIEEQIILDRIKRISPIATQQPTLDDQIRIFLEEFFALPKSKMGAAEIGNFVMNELFRRFRISAKIAGTVVNDLINSSNDNKSNKERFISKGTEIIKGLIRNQAEEKTRIVQAPKPMPAQVGIQIILAARIQGKNSNETGASLYVNDVTKGTPYTFKVEKPKNWLNAPKNLTYEDGTTNKNYKFDHWEYFNEFEHERVSERRENPVLILNPEKSVVYIAVYIPV